MKESKLKQLLWYLLVITGFLACHKKADTPTVNTSADHVEYFGFTIIDTYWDDPTDLEIKSNYADEVYRFSNLADILALHPTDSIVPRVRTFNNFAMKAILHVNELFFEVVDTNSPSGTNYDLRPDYQNRWDQFVAANRSILNENFIGARGVPEAVKMEYERIGKEITGKRVSKCLLRTRTRYR